MTLPPPSATTIARAPSWSSDRASTAREVDQFRRLEQLIESAWRPLLDDGDVWSPPVDIEEQDDAWVVEAELPGVDRKDVDVEVRGSELVVSGEIKERERTGILRRRTRRTGAFAYTVTLPGDPDPDGIEAVLDNGVLRVTVPKRERTQPRRVEVRSG